MKPTISNKIVGAVLTLLGLSAVAIGLSIFFFGALETARLFDGIMRALFYKSADLSAFQNANVDSELRFYSVFFIAFGALCLNGARDVTKNYRMIVVLMTVFFLGGVGRALSYIFVEPPSFPFVFLMWIELILPPLVGLLIRPHFQKSK